MPGFSAECDMGQHAACAMPMGQCRCRCHPWTAELYAKKANPADHRGGLKRKGKARDAAIVVPAKRTAPIPAQIDIEDEVPSETELHNTCPKCLTRAKATDQFCRKDGTKLCLGKPCPRCTAPANEPDEFCWQCGWKLDDRNVPAPTSISTPAEIPMRGRPMPSLSGKEVQFTPLEMPGAPAPTIDLPPGASELMSERNAPGSITVSPSNGSIAELPSETPTGEDPILRLRRLARQRGLLPPEIVVS